MFKILLQRSALNIFFVVRNHNLEFINDPYFPSVIRQHLTIRNTVRKYPYIRTVKDFFLKPISIIVGITILCRFDGTIKSIKSVFIHTSRHIYTIAIARRKITNHPQHIFIVIHRR
ncbi:MAG: hypothetical protein [Circoviridae sp.]|nr:MAG: hypothetical protein [Circoviridae sp.]